MIYKFWKRGDIFYVKNPHDESQKGMAAIIVSNEEVRVRNSVNIVHLTKNPKENSPTHVNITSAPNQSVALCEHVKTIYEDSLDEKIGSCTEEEMTLIDSALRLSLKLDLSTSNESKLSDNEEIIKLKMETEMYKKLYTNLLERVLPK